MKKLSVGGVIAVYLLSIAVFCGFLPERESSSATDFGVMCINAMYPSAGIELADSRDNEEPLLEDSAGSGRDGADGESEESSGTASGDSSGAKDGASTDGGKGGEDGTSTGDGEAKDPLVLILHTHATESYLPTSSGNFHSKNEENTVRDVGNVLAASLEKEGISVVHDKTLHDDPSYNNSYNRSYETAAALLKKYPTVKCVIDLHRDAVASEAPAATVSINGKECAKYSYVVGALAGTYESNMAFIKRLNQVAAEKYGGFTGKILERGYRYNQDLCSKFLLMEIGFNRNQIQECRNTAEIVGKIMAEVLKEE